MGYAGLMQMTQRAFDNLGEYSCSLPTGTIIGKKWKRNNFRYAVPNSNVPEWEIGEYVEHPNPKKIGIRWWMVEIVDN